MAKCKIRTRNIAALLCAIVCVLSLSIGLIVWGNKTVGTTHYEIVSDRLPRAFDGFKIAQISDLHNAELGKDNSKIITALQEEAPDLIAMTGDLIDSKRTDIEIAIGFVRQAMQIAPCYFVTGNHEAWSGAAYEEIEARLVSLGVRVLHDETLTLTREGESIDLTGLDDPAFLGGGAYSQSVLSDKLDRLSPRERFQIVLSHRPEAFEAYVAHGVDLVLSGHAHGGQFRLPLLGGLIAPDQGLFPKYDAGVYTQAKTAMIVSRGVGNSVIPVRINNRPEIVIVMLRSDRL